MAKISYKGWPNCYQLSNGLVDLIATTDVGPRIIRFGFSGEENAFQEFEPVLGKTGGDEWNIYGGHRLWHAPEVQPRTYEPDNGPVKLEVHKKLVRLVQPPERISGIQKEIDLYLDPKEAHVRVVHRLRNTGVWAVELAPWALSVMARGGKAIIPLPPRGEHPRDLAPANTITMWSYTDMSDPRWTWGNKYILLRQDPQAATATKIGVSNAENWAAYANNGKLFVKTFTYVPGAAYPDGGCNLEAFTFPAMLELESLGPLVKLEPKAEVEYTENWHLFRDVPLPANDADVDKYVLPRVKAIRG